MKTIRLSAFLLTLLISLFSCQQDEDIILNRVPIAEAGHSVNITLPVKSISLSGTGTDTDGQIVAYLWSQVSGPASTNITNPGAASTDINGFVEGNYVFQLMVTDDDGATGVDTVAVSVNPAVEKTVTIQPSNNPDEKMLVTIGGKDQSFQGSKEWVVDAWTVNGQSYTGRVAFKFDLSSVPATATIVQASLYLYSNNPPINGNLQDPNYGSANGLVLQQITSQWSPATADWFHQPQTTETNEVLIPATSQSVLDLNINVTDLVSAMIKTDSNYGFLMKLQNEVEYNSRMFVSSYHPEKTSKHPKLVVIYK